MQKVQNMKTTCEKCFRDLVLKKGCTGESEQFGFVKVCWCKSISISMMHRAISARKPGTFSFAKPEPKPKTVWCSRTKYDTAEQSA